METLGERLAFALERLEKKKPWLASERPGKKKRWLAYELDVSDTTIDRWLSGARKPSYDHILPLAQLLEVDVVWLLSGKGDPEPTDGAAPGGGPERTEPRVHNDASPQMERRTGLPDRRRPKRG